MTDKEDSTPSSPIRDHLVDTAVSFLLNPDVQKRQNNNKIDFLKKKGLSDVEITAAFERAKFDPRYNSNFSDAKQFENSCPPIPISNTYVPYSFWSQLSNFSSSLIVFGVAIYGLQYFYKKYIKPWLLGDPEEVDSLTQIIIELKNNLAMLSSSVEKLNVVVEKQNEDINKLMQIEGLDYTPTPIILDELKREVSSLKSILISRHQFPAAPQLQQVRASIPTWQLPAADSDQEDDSSTQTKPELQQNTSDEASKKEIISTEEKPSVEKNKAEPTQTKPEPQQNTSDEASKKEIISTEETPSVEKNKAEPAVIHDKTSAISNGIHAQ